jgi:hypothetical protein
VDESSNDLLRRDLFNSSHEDVSNDLDAKEQVAKSNQIKESQQSLWIVSSSWDKRPLGADSLAITQVNNSTSIVIYNLLLDPLLAIVSNETIIGRAKAVGWIARLVNLCVNVKLCGSLNGADKHSSSYDILHPKELA